MPGTKRVPPALDFDRPQTLADARAPWDAAGVDDYQLSYSEFRPEGMSTPVLPGLDGFGTDWTASAEVGRLDVTPRSALLVIDDEDIPDPGPFPITLEVAGETHTLPWN